MRGGPGHNDSGRGAIFVLPTTTGGQLGPVASWISTAGWAAAAQRVLGDAWIVTGDGVLPVDVVRARAAEAPARRAERARRAVPPLLKTMVKDLREARRARQMLVPTDGPWSGRQIAFVWQRHELFHGAGVDLAARLGVPSVLFVPAPIVWQARQWGVRRPGWGRWLEHRGERATLERADLVACGTDVVAEQVARLGVPADRVLVTPTGVDLSLFEPRPDRAVARRSLAIDDDDFVIGWAGSFRAFHGLDQLVRATASVPGASLLLVGDGPERPRIEELASAAGVRARFTGTVPHPDLPRLLAAMDVGAVLARPDDEFHYSPLKLAEYLAAGLPVVVPSVGQIADRFGPDSGVTLIVAGDLEQLSTTLRDLRADAARRVELGARASRAAERFSWDEQVRAVDARLS